MDAASVIAAYRAAFTARGAKMVRLRRLSGLGNARVAQTSTPVATVVTGLAEEGLIGNMREGERMALLIVADVVAATVEPVPPAEPEEEGDPEPVPVPVAWPAPILRGDELILADGSVLKVESVDMETRSMAGEAIAYQLRVSG